MTTPRKLEIVYLPIGDIQVGARLRDANEKSVAAIDGSIGEIGLLSPLHVQKRKDGYFLLDGLHRLRASERAGSDHVPVIVHRVGQTEGLKIEIGAALAGAQLDALSTAVFLARHKELYEAEHPEARAATGAELVAKRWDTGVKNTVVSFAENAASTLNCSNSKITKLVRVGSSLSPEDVALLRKAPKAIKQCDLEALAKVDPAMRSLVCRELSMGKIKSVKEALDRQKAPGASLKTEKDTEFRKLNDAFARASKATRMRFVEMHREALEALLAQGAPADGDPADVVPFKARERG